MKNPVPSSVTFVVSFSEQVSGERLLASSKEAFPPPGEALLAHLKTHPCMYKENEVMTLHKSQHRSQQVEEEIHCLFTILSLYPQFPIQT